MKKITEMFTTDNFKKGQINIINFVLENVQGELAEFENGNVGYMLRETKKDALYVMKMLIKCQIYQHLIEQLESAKEQILNEKGNQND